MRTTARSLLPAAAFAALLLLPTGARAQTSPDALYDEAIALSDQGRHDAAYAKFKDAYEQGKQPRARAQMALEQAELGRWLGAELDLLAVLAVDGDAWIASHKSALQENLQKIQSHLGWLEVTGEPGAAIVLNGQPLGTLPLAKPARVEVGELTIEASKDGFYPLAKPVKIQAGVTSTVALDLAKRPPPVATTPLSEPVESTRATRSSAPPADVDHSTQRTVGYVGLGVAVVATGVGAVALLKRNAAANDYNADGSCPGEGAPTQPAACGDRLSTVSSWRTASIVGFGVGGAIGLTSIVLLVTAPSTSRAPATAASATTWACGGGPGDVGVACRVRF
jgi:hypothetical protein